MLTDLTKAACRTHFGAFAENAFKVIEPATHLEYNWHIGCIAAHLEASYRGEIPKLIINIAPRFLKSVLVAQLYPAWLMGHEPHHQIIGASYAHSLAQKNVVKCRQVMQSEFYAELFPKTVISDDQNQKDYFTTPDNGQYKGTGIGGTITGFGCHTLIIDDPINPREAASQVIRDNANEEIRSTLFSRFNDSRKKKFIMIMQRVHENDPTGNLMADGGYHLLKIPAQATSPIIIDLGKHQWKMAEGELLDPKRTPLEVLDEKRQELLEYNYVGQYLQEPVPVGGGVFRAEWLNYYAQGGVKPKDMNVVILVDPSGGEAVNKKKKKLSDWTAMMVIGLAPDNNYYLLDIIRDRLNPTERIDTLFSLHRRWNEICEKPPKVGYERISMQSDTHYIREKMRTEGYNFTLTELTTSVNKEERIMQLVPDMENGRWILPDKLFYIDKEGRQFDLVQELIKAEMATFPRSRYDDMLDAMSYVYDKNLNAVFPRQNIKPVSMKLANTGSWMG